MSATGPLIEVNAASRWYGNVVAVNDVTFSLQPGITGLLGPNGAGKSTVINMITGLLQPSSGSVAINGNAAWNNPGMYRQLGYVPEREAVYTFLTARQFVVLNAELQQLPAPGSAADAALASVGLVEAADRKLATFSKGMKQRAKLAAALVHQPSILILDEPFNGLDPRQRQQMIQILRLAASEGKCVLVSSHILQEVERLAERVLVMIAGRLAASGGPREIRRLMKNRPHAFRIRSSDNRALAALLVDQLSVNQMELDERHLTVRTQDYGAFVSRIAPVAAAASLTLFELVPIDESLESVFNYLVEGKGN